MYRYHAASAVIGFFVGILPRRGDHRQRHHLHDGEKLSGNSDSFGKGDIRGVAAPEAANNASACGSFIPMLTLGVPGSGTTAVMMGALTLYNITPDRRCSPNSRISSGADCGTADCQRNVAGHEHPADWPVHPYADHSAVVPGTRNRGRLGSGVYGYTAPPST